jgi:DNA polymerase-3 subunit gamma/tau
LTLKERRGDLLDFLRGELRNQKIQLETNLIESVSQSKPYTAGDKYRVMVEKNPALKALKESLDLELEL